MVGLSVGRGDAAAHRHRLGLRLVDALEVELGGFMRPNAVHRPGKAVCDLAGDSGTAIAGIAAARARASAAAGLLPGGALPLVDGHVIVDRDEHPRPQHQAPSERAPAASTDPDEIVGLSGPPARQPRTPDRAPRETSIHS